MTTYARLKTLEERVTRSERKSSVVFVVIPEPSFQALKRAYTGSPVGGSDDVYGDINRLLHEAMVTVFRHEEFDEDVSP